MRRFITPATFRKEHYEAAVHQGRRLSGFQFGKSEVVARVPQTVKHHLTVLHSALRQAVRWRLLAWNPCDAVGNVKVPRARKQALDVDEANMLIEALKDHELGRLFRLAMVTGMRPGEYLGLRWADVDLKSKRLTVRQGVWQRNRKDVRQGVRGAGSRGGRRYGVGAARETAHT